MTPSARPEAQEMTKEQIEQIANAASDYDNWIINRRDSEGGPAYPLEPHLVRALCNLALASLSADRVSVPVNPTFSMLVAGKAACDSALSHVMLDLVWKAMLAAAPSSQGNGDGARKVGHSALRATEEWVACSERLPKENHIVLLAKEFDGPGDWRIKCGYWWSERGWTVWGASWTPSHWMPLPAAPQPNAVPQDSASITHGVDRGERLAGTAPHQGNGEMVSETPTLGYDDLSRFMKKVTVDSDVVDWDLKGSPITSYQVLLWGAYGDCLVRLINAVADECLATARADERERCHRIKDILGRYDNREISSHGVIEAIRASAGRAE